MEWMDDTDGRRAAVERAYALAKLDGRTRYVVCSPGWPIVDEKPEPEPGIIEWVQVTRA